MFSQPPPPQSTFFTQLAYASVLSIIYAMLMMVVIVGLLRQEATNGFCSVSTTFLETVMSIFVVTAALHPREMLCLLHGFLYFLWSVIVVSL